MRIVSLLPSATEIVHALNRGADLVGRSEECDFPPSVRELPVVMRARTRDFEAPSRAIDDRVRRERTSGESLYELDLDLLRSLVPDVLLTQDLCGVCSVTEAEVETACRSAGLRPRIVSLTPRRLVEVWESIRRVGDAIRAASSADRLATSLRTRVPLPAARPAAAPRVAIVEWLDPPILAGLWSPDIVVAAGGRPVGVDAGAPGVRTTWATLARSPPDLLVVAPCSFSVDRTRHELRSTGLLESVGSVRARLGTFLADEAYFSRPGPRLADGVELVRALLAGGEGQGPMPVERWSAAAEVTLP